MVNNIAARHDMQTAAPSCANGAVPTHVEHAARAGDEAVVCQWLDGGGDVNARTVYQSQLIHVAARYSQAGVLRVLLRASGIDINALDYGGMRRTSLHWGCKNGDLLCVEELVQAGANRLVQGKTWSKLVQGRRCGNLIQSDTATEHSPAEVCKNNLVRLALFQPLWKPDTHHNYPEAFREAARVLVLAAGSSNSPAAEPPSAKAAAAWPLSLDVTCRIIAAAAYPLSAWVTAAT